MKRFDHRVDRYAQAVHEGDIVAGPYVRLACKRHLDDRAKAARKSGHPHRFAFVPEKANHIIDFYEKVLRLPDTLDEEGDPIPFLLTPANTFIVGSIFGWQQHTGYRRFREAYIEMGKGNAKTPLAAGIGLYGLTMDGEMAPEIYSVATGIDQARICWLDADRMVESSPELSELIHRSKDNLAYAANFGWFRPLSKEKRGKSGPRPHIVIFDEEHEYADAVVANKMRAGTKRRRQPLMIAITNSGFDRTSICWQHHEQSRKMLEQLAPDEQLFAYVCALVDNDDPLTDESCWIKANPNLGVVIQPEYLRRQVRNAKSIPAETNTVLRLNFCMWTQAQTRFFDMMKWRACSTVIADDELAGVPSYGGLDLGQSDDLCAWVRIWLLEDDRVAVRARFWLPEAALTKYPDRPYAEWRRAGLLEITEGDITDYDVVEQSVLDDARASGTLEIAYDKRFAQQMALHLQGAGLTLVDTPQGFQLNEAIKRMSEWVVIETLCHGANDILTWMADNTVVRHGRNKEVRLDKDASNEKIDGIAALAMAISRAIVEPIEPPSVYESRGVIRL